MHSQYEIATREEEMVMECGPCAMGGTVSTAAGMLSMTFGSVAEVGMCERHGKMMWDWFMDAFATVAVIDGEEP
ncbi:hypothetical protein ACFYZH_09955 [Streptomyces abikoensis]|uniref:hypothetical protein n=1 Tax=Streptomyces abikoensis TaxID=97398 RepID=UPI0036799F5A